MVKHSRSFLMFEELCALQAKKPEGRRINKNAGFCFVLRLKMTCELQVFYKALDLRTSYAL